MDDATFDAFYDRTAADVARHVYLLTASPHRAVYATHRAYARAYTDWESLGPTPNLESWVRMTASDIALDYLHRARRRITRRLHTDRIARTVDRIAASRGGAVSDPSDEAAEGTAAAASPNATATSEAGESSGTTRPIEGAEDPRQAALPRTPGGASVAPAPAAPFPHVPSLDPTPAPGAPVPDDEQWAADVALLRALLGVPAHRRRAVVLHHFAGMTAEEIAAETESTVGSTQERISMANHQLARDIGVLADLDPDGPEAHARIAADMRDLAARYQPELQTSELVRTGTQGRAKILVAAVGAAILGLLVYTAVVMVLPGSLPDERAEVRASISARAAAGLPLVAEAPKPPIAIGRSTARAEHVPEDRQELVRITGTASRDGGTFLTVDSVDSVDSGGAANSPGSADAPADSARRGVRDLPLSPKVAFRGAEAFGLSKQQVVYAGDFLAKAAEGALAEAVFEVEYDEDDQVILVREHKA